MRNSAFTQQLGINLPLNTFNWPADEMEDMLRFANAANLSVRNILPQHVSIAPVSKLLRFRFCSYFDRCSRTGRYLFTARLVLSVNSIIRSCKYARHVHPSLLKHKLAISGSKQNTEAPK